MAYSDTQVARLRAAAPLNLAKAQDLASEFGVSYRSIISKATQLGIAYDKKAPAAKKAAESGPTKAVIVAGIRQKLSLADREGDLTKAELEAILAAL